jgi:hypothetical protein
LLGKASLDFGSTRVAIPSGINPLENILGCRFAGQKLECFRSRFGTSRIVRKALTDVHGTAAPCNLGKRFIQNRVGAANINLQCSRATPVLQNSFGLPRLQLAQLIWKSLGITGQFEASTASTLMLCGDRACRWLRGEIV